MEKRKVVVITDDINRRLELKNFLTDDRIAVTSFLQYEENTLIKIKGQSPDAIIIVNEEDERKPFYLAREVFSTIKGCPVIMITNSLNIEIFNKAMQCGISRVLDASTDINELVNNIESAITAEMQRLNVVSEQKALKTRVISLFSGKGGTGKTTIAVNLATTLSNMGKKVIVLDFDLQFGDANLLLDIEPKETVSDLAQDKSEMTYEIIKGFTKLHNSGISILCAPKSPELAEYISSTHIEKIINIIRPYYEYVIIDLTPSFNDVTIAAMENSDDIFLVSGLDISSFRNAKICLNVLDSLMQKEKASVILNKVADSIIKEKDYENLLELKIIGKVSEDSKTALKSLNQGVPIVMAAPRSPVTKEIKSICDKLIS